MRRQIVTTMYNNFTYDTVFHLTACVYLVFCQLTTAFGAVFQGKFLFKPSVLVTAEHQRSGLKRDAASLWIEDATQSSFKICLRELQNYAGSHENISVVSV